MQYTWAQINCPDLPLKTLITAVFGFLSTVLMLPPIVKAEAAPSQSVGAHSEVVRLIDLSRYGSADYDTAVLGMSDRNTLITARYGIDGRCAIDLWNVNTGVVKAKIVPPAPIYSGSVVLSPDGERLMATQNVATDRKPAVYFPHLVYVWDLATRRLTRTIDLGEQSEVNGAFFASNSTHAIVTCHIFARGPEDGRFVSVDLNSGRQYNIRSYKYASQLDRHTTTISPDGKLLIGLYPAGEGQPDGKFDVFDANNFSLVARVDGADLDRELTTPMFFISKSAIVFGDTLYYLNNHKATSVLPGHKDLRGLCLAHVPNRPDCALFVIKSGTSEPNLELWNIATNSRLKRWVLTRRPRSIPLEKSAPGDRSEPVLPTAAFISPDDKSFCTLDDRGVVRVWNYNFDS